jgi:hypothetical protein
VEAEGELYRIRECAEYAVDSLSKHDDFLSACLQNHGRDAVIDRLEKIMREKLGDESSGTFKLNPNGLRDSVNECRKYFFDLTLQEMLVKDMLEVSLDKEGQLCFTVKQKR